MWVLLLLLQASLTATILVMRQALKKTAKRFRKQKLTPGKIVPSHGGKGGGEEIIPDSLDWLSDNLLVVLGVVLFLLFLHNY